MVGSLTYITGFLKLHAKYLSFFYSYPPPLLPKLPKDNYSDPVRFLDQVISSFKENVIQVSPFSWLLLPVGHFPPVGRLLSSGCTLLTPTCFTALQASGYKSCPPLSGSSGGDRPLCCSSKGSLGSSRYMNLCTSLKNVSFREARPDLLSTSGSIVIYCHHAFCFLSTATT